VSRFQHLRARAGIAALVLLAGCAVTAPQDTDRRVNPDGTACPDTRRPLPFPVARPECWTDAEWNQYLQLEAQRARSGDRYNEWSYF
jgi:hypothetical protein